MSVFGRSGRRSPRLTPFIFVPLLMFGILGASGCDASFLSEAPVQVCKEVATQCQLAKGPLGVCERAACAEDQAEPCFACTPQH